MIQRKQTIYLLISGILMTLMPFINVAIYISNSDTFLFDSMGLRSSVTGELVQPTWALFGLNVLIVLLSYVAIFGYRNRVRQMRITMFNLLLKIGFIAYAYFIISRMQIDGLINQSYSAWASLPFIAIIFDYLAHRGIAIDEQKVRYMDRLR